MRVVLCIALSAALVGCGGKLDTIGGGDASIKNDSGVIIPGDAIAPPSNFCDQQATREKKCNLKKSTCLDTCFDNAIRPEAIGPLENCLLALPCDGDDQTCATQVGQPYASDPAFLSYQKDCFAAQQGCPEVNTRYCGLTGALLTQTLRSALDNCFFVNGPCDSMITCIDTAITNDGCSP